MPLKTFEYTKIIGKENIEFGHDVIIDDFVFIYAQKKMKIGNFVHIASFCSINGGDHFEIQDFTAISSGSRIVTKTDDFKNWGFGNSTIPEKYRNIYQAPIIIEKFSIIGSNCVILPGVTIGEGVAVGAGSIVSKNLEPWGVYLGNKRVRERDKAGVMATYDKFLNGY